MFGGGRGNFSGGREIEATWKEIFMKKDHLMRAKSAKEVAIQNKVVGSRGSRNVTFIKNLGTFRKIVDSKIFKDKEQANATIFFFFDRQRKPYIKKGRATNGHSTRVH